MRNIALSLFAASAVAACLASAPRVASAQVRVDRLERLAAHLEAGPADGFDVSDWSSCAAGRATEVAEFGRAGFRLAGVGGRQVVVYGESLAYAACSAFFGLSADDTRIVFNPGSYPNRESRRDPKVAAARIRAIADLELAKVSSSRERRHRPQNRASLCLAMD